MRTPLAALAALFLVVHLLSLPRTLEDIDSINFALGVRQFDVTAHQPHPPGYPVFIGLARLSTAVLERLGVPAAAPRGLSLWSAVAGALLVPLLFSLFRTACRDPRTAWWATAVTVCSPLFWFAALRPLSDMTGLAAAVVVQLLLLPLLLPEAPARSGGANPEIPGTSAAQSGTMPGGAVRSLARPGLRLIAAAALCGVGAGVRSQTVVLTAPLLALALCWPVRGVTMRHRALSVGAAAAGASLWGVPLIVLSGGLGNFLAALGSQAGEDFAGVEMLWTTRQPRVALNALLNSFVWPWGSLWVAVVVLGLASAGTVLGLWRSPRMLLALAVAFLPYAVFHLLFQETITMRYALPLVPPVAFLAVYGASRGGRLAVAAAGALLVAVSLNATLPAVRAYVVDGSPAFRLFSGALVPARPDVLGLHGVMRRVEEWERASHGAEVLRAPHGREWLALVGHWRAHPGARVHFLADPRRTDLALFDPQARRLAAAARWTLPEVPFVAGTRPGPADLYAIDAPGWMLDRGWALTAEIGGVTARDGLGPAVQPAVAWIRARSDAMALVIGGRNLAAAGGPPARLTVAADGGPIDTWTVPPGPFFRHVSVPAGTLRGSGYLPLRVSAEAVDAPVPPVALEQFDAQPDGIVMFGFLEGWQEPEYNPRLGVAWRWMSERARLWVRPVGRDLTLTLRGESPLRYFDAAPAVRVSSTAGELARFRPSDDFTQEMRIPHDVLASAGGVLTIESSQWFSPAERSGHADQRHLALRIFSVSVR